MVIVRKNDGRTTASTVGKRGGGGGGGGGRALEGVSRQSVSAQLLRFKHGRITAPLLLQWAPRLPLVLLMSW